MSERYSDDRSGGGGGHGGGSSGRWLVSYADFVTLMFVVFVVLFSMARLDNAKFSALKQSLGQSSIGIEPLPSGGNPLQTAPITPGSDKASAPGAPAAADPTTVVAAPPIPAVVMPAEPKAEPEPGPTTPEPTTPKPQTPATKPVADKPVTDPLIKVSEGLKNTAPARAGQMDIEVETRGIVISVLTSVLFAEGQAELKPGANQILDSISSQLKASSESVVVEGAPDASDREAPWDLASRRASAVVSYLVSTHGLAPQRFSVIGYGKGAGTDGIVNVVVLRRQ